MNAAILAKLHTLDEQGLAEVLDLVDFIAAREALPKANEGPVRSIRGKYRLMSSSEAFAV